MVQAENQEEPVVSSELFHHFEDPSEKVMERKMIKIIDKMKGRIQNRMKSLYVMSVECDKLDDLFEAESRAL